MAESVDAPVSNTGGAIHPGSIPGPGTQNKPTITGRMPEWSIGAVSKTVVPLREPRVRIPVFPQKIRMKPAAGQRVSFVLHLPGPRHKNIRGSADSVAIRVVSAPRFFNRPTQKSPAGAELFNVCLN